MGAEKVDGPGWLLGRVGEKKAKAPVKLTRAEKVEPHEVDEVVRMFDDVGGAGKRLAAGVEQLGGALQQIIACGLTPEALIILVREKCRCDRKGNQTTTDQVERVLEGLFRLPEYLAR